MTRTLPTHLSNERWAYRMNNTHKITTIVAAAGICGALLTSASGTAQTQDQGRTISPARLQAGRINIFDRQGKVITQVGPRAVYGATIFSPDRKRLAAVKLDFENENRDIWVFDLESALFSS